MPRARRRLEVDGVDTDTELLNQLQPRRLLDDGRRHPLEHMKQNVGVMNLAGERRFVGLVDDGDAQPIVLERGESRRGTQAWRDTAGQLSW